jgi:hypothetical protein
MLIVDDILLFPARSILWVFREVHNAAQQERASEPERIAAELRELYMLLETGKISEEQFAAQEKVLLDRLDEIEKRDSILAEEQEDEPDDSEEDAGNGST